MNVQLLTLEAVSCGPTINSHGRLTDEYTVHCKGGVSGRGSAPAGETLSRYESQLQSPRPGEVMERLKADRIIGAALSQRDFDDYLSGNASQFGPGAVFSLSCAFFEAAFRHEPQPPAGNQPRLCLNILNGHRHAYTNPVLSDFHEFLLVPEHGDLRQLLEDHLAIQGQVRARLAAHPTSHVNGNLVHILGNHGNRDVIEFLLGIVGDLGLADQYCLMIDAAAGQLWTGSEYSLDLAERKDFDPGGMADYWLSLLSEYPISFLEDPFAEHDLENWHRLTANSTGCRVAGDDVICGDAARIRQLLGSRSLNAVVLKPDQAGTISATLAAVEAAREFGAPVILSHRSIGTDSLALAHLLVQCGIGMAKFGPLLSDFSAVMKINEILRFSRDRVVSGPPPGAAG